MDVPAAWEPKPEPEPDTGCGLSADAEVEEDGKLPALSMSSRVGLCNAYSYSCGRATWGEKSEHGRSVDHGAKLASVQGSLAGPAF